MLTHLASGFGATTTATLMVFGLYATIKTRGGALRAFPAMLRQITSPQQTGRPISPFRAFATSLAGTIGVGNITGVALAITLGGAGAVFWMWISALLCMTVKQFEIYLAVKHQPKEETHYGFAPMTYIKKITESKGFAGLFALFGLFSALTMGSMIQTDAAVHGAKSAFGVAPWVTAVLFSVGVGVFLSGGIPRNAGALEKTLPLLGGIFLLTGLVVIGFRYDRILPAFGRIFTEAFSFSSLSGGVLGSGFALGFRYGVGNGLFSHEAGLGSGGLAHGACGADPLQQSLWGIFEVFFDTVVISTVSALMILTAESAHSSEGVLTAAHEVLGPVGKGIVALCLILFAFLSVLSWSCYGETCFVWLTSKKGAVIYRILFLLSPVLSLFAAENTL
ncbi:MAG: sodium:alanine symporter family protein, partial [Clostridia bacterium]|nr:sodium:alanine symporter family protein [Clostridia bacterium]